MDTVRSIIFTVSVGPSRDKIAIFTENSTGENVSQKNTERPTIVDDFHRDFRAADHGV